MKGPLHIKFGKDDQDLVNFFDSLARGTKSEQAKNLIRLGLAVQGLDALQLLVKKGIVDPAQVAATGQPEQAATVSEEQKDLFLKNMAGSWD